MLEGLKKLLKREQDTIKPVKIYSLKLEPTDKASTKDINLMQFFLNFTPEKDNLACDIKTFGENVEDIFVYIYCQTSKNEWNNLKSDMVEIKEFLKLEDEIESFLFLIDYENEANENLIIEQAINFINEDKFEFQSKCVADNQIYIQRYSDINHYKITWGNSEYVNLILKSFG